MREAMRRMVEMGHAVGCVANYGLSGSSLTWGAITVYPVFEARNNADFIDYYASHFEADLLLSLYDVWSLPGGVSQRLPCPWAGMVPVDGTPVTQVMLQRMREMAYVVAYSEFGVREIRKMGIGDAGPMDNSLVDVRYIPHAVDTKTFSPVEEEQKGAIRDRMGMPRERFIVTIVGANKGFPARKGWVEMLAGFERFRQRHEEAFLYCHTTKRPWGSAGAGIYFDQLYPEIGIPKDSIAFPQQGALAVGVPEGDIANIYRASDVVLLASMGEGFGLPLCEAEACGVPIITQACSAMTENTVNGIAIEPLQPYWVPQLGYWWQLPSIEGIVEALEEVYDWSPEHRRQMCDEGLQFIRQERAWDVVWERYWVPFLEHVEETLW